MSDRYVLLFAVLALLFASVVVAIGVGSGTQPITTLDADTPLTSTDATQQYADEGHVSVDVRQLNMSVGVSESHGPVGLDGPRVDLDKQYVRIDYNEEIARTIRIYIPSEMVRPRVNADLEPVGDGPVASVEPVENRSYSALTVRVDGETDVVYPMSVEAGMVFGARSWVRDTVSNGTGFDIPEVRLSSGTWSYLNASDWTNRTTTVPQGTQTIQYERRDEWLTVPDCDGDGTAVCRYRSENATVLLSADGDPPRIRYQQAEAPGAGVESAWNELTQLVADLRDRISGFLGG